MVITLLPLLLPIAVLARWCVTGWLPISTAHEELDFMCLTIGGIPIEDLMDAGMTQEECEQW